MADWIAESEFAKSEYGRLDKILDGKKYLGNFDRSKQPPGSSLVLDPKDQAFGILKGRDGNPIGKVAMI